MKSVICTVASHSALQIMRGAKDEGFKTLLVSTEGRKKTYERFPGLVDEYYIVKDFKTILDEKVQNDLIEKNAVIVPTGSFVAYIGDKEFIDYKVPMFGNKRVLEWESNRAKEREWLEKAGVRMPFEFKKPEDIDRLAICKYHGAKGGSGYFLAKNAEEFYEKAGDSKPKDFMFQEYVIGTRFYPHYFYSPLTKENELLGIDIRYESNADALGRLQSSEIKPTYTVTGNIPVVLRESLLPKYFEIADNTIKASKELFSPGLSGPYCIETIVTEDLEIIAFEISARIVAGTNAWVPGSPYSYFRHGELISTGRRIAMELKKAEKENKLGEILS